MNWMLDGEYITVVVEKKKNKNIYMRFMDPNTIKVTCNSWVSKREIEHILEKNKDSLRKMKRQKEKEQMNDSYFNYLGKKYIKVFDNITKEPTFQDDFIYVKDEKTLHNYYKKECIRIFQSEVDRILPYFKNVPKFRLVIRKMKTRWGVNNYSSHTITLNSELLKKDLDLIDYVIIHELCHFYEANHSQHFWDHVSVYYPKYKEARKRLRDG